MKDDRMNEDESLIRRIFEISELINRRLDEGCCITLTGKQLSNLLELCDPGMDKTEHMETEVTVFLRKVDEVSIEGEHLPKGLYAYITEYPEEGCIKL